MVQLYFTISGEKIYIEKTIKPSKIKGFGNLTITYYLFIERREWMEKLEIVYQLQEAIEQLYHETDVFEINMKEILALTTAKRFIPDNVLERACKQLETIRKLEGICREGYNKLEMAGEIPEYIEQMRMALTLTERLLKEREIYFLAKEEFLQLYSEQKEVKEPLLLCQKELAGYRIEAMTEEEVKYHLEKYVLFIKAWREKEAIELIDYVQKLLKEFPKELAAAAVFQKEKLILKNAKKEEKIASTSAYSKEIEPEVLELEENKKLKEKTVLNFISKEANPMIVMPKIVQQDFEQKQSEDKIKQKFESPENQSVRESEDKSKNKSENQPEKNSTFLKKYTYLVKVESCAKKEKKKFGVKSFRSDLSGITEGLRKRILRGIRQYGGVTVELLAAITRKTQQEVRQECETLFYNGYLRLYKVEGMGELYSVSPKGKRAFEVWEALAFLHIKGKLPEWRSLSLEETKDMGCAAATKLMFLKALTSEYKKRAFPDIQVEHQIEQNVFFLKCRDFDQTDWRYYTGASEWIEDEKTYIQWLKAFMEEKEEDRIEKIEITDELELEELSELEEKLEEEKLE